MHFSDVIHNIMYFPLMPTSFVIQTPNPTHIKKFNGVSLIPRPNFACGGPGVRHVTSAWAGADLDSL